MHIELNNDVKHARWEELPPKGIMNRQKRTPDEIEPLTFETQIGNHQHRGFLLLNDVKQLVSVSFCKFSTRYNTHTHIQD